MKKVVQYIVIIICLVIVGCKEQINYDLDKTFRDYGMDKIIYNDYEILLHEKQLDLPLNSSLHLDSKQVVQFYDSVAGVYELDVDAIDLDRISIYNGNNENVYNSNIKKKEMKSIIKRWAKQDVITISKKDIFQSDGKLQGEFQTEKGRVRIKFHNGRDIVCEGNPYADDINKNGFSYFFKFNSDGYDGKLKTVIYVHDEERNIYLSYINAIYINRDWK